MPYSGELQKMLKLMTGNDAAAYGARLSRPEIVCAYPITPQSQIPEKLAYFHGRGELKGRFVNVESEMAALGYVTGAAICGVRVFTATSSQGLAWMHEGLHWAAGARLPIVLVNVNRPLGAPWNLTCDQTDSLSQRDTGWLQFYCESNQEILDTVIQAYSISETLSLPSMVCLDGVYLSYLSETVDIPDQEMVDQYLPPLNPGYKIEGGGWKLYDIFPPDQNPHAGDLMADRYELHKRESQCLATATACDEAFRAVFGRGYSPVEEYCCEDADVVLVMSGSAVGTARDVIDRIREEGHRVGLLKIKMFRPFPKDLLREKLAGRKKIAVIERDLSPGQCGIFYQELKWALCGSEEPLELFGFVSGLGGADITPELIIKAIRYVMASDQCTQDVIWLGMPQRKNPDEYDRKSITIQ
jgi:pyruvate/2-oxoacid:ferredoxin oxidoreductase alpha subunit